MITSIINSLIYYFALFNESLKVYKLKKKDEIYEERKEKIFYSYPSNDSDFFLADLDDVCNNHNNDKKIYSNKYDIKNKIKKSHNNEYIVEEIISHRGKNNNIEFLVKWQDYSELTYEPIKNLKNCYVFHNYIKKHRDLHFLRNKFDL
jgi:N-methylhydantoinase B/oxoprolinase/acetone carboxylase alpha subunit